MRWGRFFSRMLSAHIRVFEPGAGAAVTTYITHSALGQFGRFVSPVSWFASKLYYEHFFLTTVSWTLSAYAFSMANGDRINRGGAAHGWAHKRGQMKRVGYTPLPPSATAATKLAFRIHCVCACALDLTYR